MSVPEGRPSRHGLSNASIVLGVTGGIAAYKAADLTSKLMQAGARIRVVMTDGATQFIQPLTFQALTHQSVFTGVFDGWNGEERGHVTLASGTDVLLIAPATADILAKLAAGIVDNMLTAVALATAAPIIVAPAMEHHMWNHPATQANVETLRSRGVTVVEPESGYLASGASGDGRLASNERIMAVLQRVLGRNGSLANRRLVISAGGTREELDPVRYLGNRSSGAMGLALADAAISRGADVTLVVGPTVTYIPEGSMQVIRVESARDMASAIWSETSTADVLVMAAAVADFRPRERAAGKIKKQPGQETLRIDLVRNPDIIAETDHPGLLKIGFAAETDDMEEHARAKIVSKGLAMIVANDAVKTIGSEKSEATLLFPDRTAVALPSMPKRELAEHILDEIETLIAARTAARTTAPQASS